MCDRSFVATALNGTAKHHLDRRRFSRPRAWYGLGVGTTFFAGASPALSASKVAIIEDTINPGLFMVPGGGPLTEDPANPGLFMIGA